MLALLTLLALLAATAHAQPTAQPPSTAGAAAKPAQPPPTPSTAGAAAKQPAQPPSTAGAAAKQPAQPPAATPATTPAPAAGAPSAAAAFVDQRLEIDDCGARPQLPMERLRQLAGEHYDRGDILYVQGDYVGSVSELVSSYCLIPHYSVLKDIGQAYERQLEYSRAIAYLKRYVDAIPPDAKPAACGPSPQEDKRNVSARIEVLATLPARISVATQPGDAEITLTGEDGLVARGVSTTTSSGGQVSARAGRYLMTVQKPGYVTHTQEITTEIGKPYAFVIPLRREVGHLSVQVIPGNARIFLDDRFVGVGRYEADLPGDTYTLLVESSDRIAERRKIEVKPQQTERVVVQMAPRPQSGRTQLLVFAPVASALVLGGSLFEADQTIGTIAAGGGLAIGGVAGYIAISDDISLGTSSATINGALGGGAMSLFTALAIGGDDDSYAGPSLALGTVLGGAAGFVAARRLNLSAGDAALVNTGMVWGGVYGGLFSAVFDNPETIDYSLTAGGIGLGLITSGLLLRSFSISRAHAALIDLGGVGGLVLSAGVRSLIDQDEASGERQANFALVGVTVGLAGAALLTRNFDDAPPPNLQPSLGKVSAIDGSSVPSYGFAGTF